MLKGLAIGLASVIVITAIVVCAIPLKTVSYTVSVPYQDVEEYQVEEPLSYTIPHYEDDYEEINGGNYNEKAVYSYLEISNADDVAGDFTVTWRCECPGDNVYVGYIPTKQVYVRPAQTEAIWDNETIPANCQLYWQVSPPTKTVTKYRIVEKQRQETRYKNVTILEYLTSY